MKIFIVHTKGTEPEESVAFLKGAEKPLGFVPNLSGKNAESLAITVGYLTLSYFFVQVIMLTDRNPPKSVHSRALAISFLARTLH